jgi:ligand-binding SRPBCC domain-containing protein
MVKQQYEVAIDAPRERVWEVLWNEDSYKQWTAPFNPGSSVETDWQEGSRVLFTDGAGSGMIARIQAVRPNEFMSFEHIGMLENGVENTTSEQVKAWAGAQENYTLADQNGQTMLTVDIDIAEDHKESFDSIFPKALGIVKELSEAR